MAKHTATPATISRYAAPADIQITAAADGGDIMQGLAVQATDEAQLRVLVFETRQALTDAVDAEVDRLGTLSAALDDRRKALAAAVAAVDTTTIAAQLDAAMAAVASLGLAATGPRVTVDRLDAERGVVLVKVAFKLDYHEASCTREIPAPAEVNDAAAAAAAADDDYKAQHAAVGALRAALADTARLEERGRYMLDRKRIGAASDGADRAAEIAALVADFTGKAAAKAAKAKAGSKQLAAPKR